LKKFNFKLQALLNYRENLEKKAKQDLAIVLRNLGEVSNKIIMLQETYENKREKFDEVMQNQLNYNEYQIFTSYLASLNMDISLAKRQKIKLQKQVLQKQEILKQKLLAKKVVEKYKERKSKEYYNNINKLEQKEFDEIAILKKAI
jgi:flagellar FliJ protein